jgi:hypothetical protein
MLRLLVVAAAIALGLLVQHLPGWQSPELPVADVHAQPQLEVPPPAQVPPIPTTPDAMNAMKTMQQCRSMADLSAARPHPNLLPCYLECTGQSLNHICGYAINNNAPVNRLVPQESAQPMSMTVLANHHYAYLTAN